MKYLKQRLALAVALSLGVGAAHAQAADLFISEYIEGSSFSKAVEIYNGTGAAVDLGTGQYRLELHSNGSATVSQSILLSGTIAAGDVFVLCHGSADAAILAACDVTNNSVINFNGDDALVLRKSSPSAGTGTILDAFGQVGTDPGSEWGTGLTSTADNTLVRISTICEGDTDGSNAFDPATQWVGFASNTFGGLGAHEATCGDGPLTISIDDVTQAEGNAGTTTFTFTVSLSAPAPEGGVSFDISTADGTASAGFDYVAKSLTGQVIPEGSSSFTFDVTVNGDTDIEGNEGFLVNVVRAGEDDLSGLGTIQNDDVNALPINQIQGSGTASPYDDQPVVTEGVVTLVRSNGFHLQSITPDADPATSEGIFVFTGGAPTVSVGDQVQVTGIVEEYLPVSYTYPVTELLPSNIVTVGTAALPAPVELTAADFAGPLLDPDVLEHLEGMYVRIASGKIVAPTRSASTEFEIVVTDVLRPIREAGISIFDPFVVPVAQEATIPYFDANQERIKLRPASGSTPLVEARGSVSDIFGALDYAGAASAVNSWQVWYDPTQETTQIVSGTPQAVSDATVDDVTISGFNMEWFFVNASDGQSGTEAQRRTKIAAVVCDWLKTPDILAAEEISSLTTLEDLAGEINATCAQAPEYEAHMLDDDPGNQQRLGFLINKRVVAGVTPRVELVEIQQHNESTLLEDPNGNPVAGEELNDRPPLRLKAVVHFADGRQYPVTVIAVHQKSLIAVDSTDAGRNGYPTEGARNRGKRAQQAVELAQLVDDIQNGVIGGNPNEKIVLVGDFNSFEVNDGYVDVMGITTGNPAPEAEVILYADSPLSEANGGTPLIVGNELIDDPEERYSYIFGNISQSLDHAVINQALLDDASITDIVVDHARVNADFRQANANLYDAPYSMANPPLRTSDHDPVRVSIRLTADASPPVISYTLDPAAANGSNGWYTGNVSINWTVVDPETSITSTTGCNATTLSSDTTGATYTCSATSAGGTSSVTTSTIRRDATAPTLAPTVPSPLLRDQSYVASPNASDATSGVASASCGPLDTSTTGDKSTTCTATDNAGNTNTVTLNYSVGTTCANDGYTSTKLSWCRNICEAGLTGATLDTWIHRWVNRYRTLPYCLLDPQENPQPALR